MTGRPQGPEVRRDCRCITVTHHHGTGNAYRRDKCRCGLCRRAIAVEKAQRNRAILYGRWDRGRVDAIGSARRLRALAVTGWSMAELGRRAGIDASSMRAVARCDRPYVMPAKAEKIRALYDALWDQPATGSSNARAKTRAWASRNGWLPPMAWDDDTIDDPDVEPMAEAQDVPAVDEVAVARAVSGHPGTLSSAEMAVVVEHLTRAGRSANEIAEWIGTSQRNVTRYRSKGRAA